MTRLPDFVVIGAMKAGTTTLFRWLESHPDCVMPEVKEPHFFSRDSEYAKGLDYYSSYFPPDDGRRTGEASVGYADPAVPAVAARMRAALPDARIVFIAREPISRLRSHFLHEFRRGRERRAFQDAVTPDSVYVRRSCYSSCLEPFVEHYGSKLLVVTMEELFAPDPAAWDQVQAHLGISPTSPPNIRVNATASKRQFSRPALWLWERRAMPDPKRLPDPVRKAGARMLLSSRSAWQRAATQVAGQGVSPDVTHILQIETEKCAALIGRRFPWQDDQPQT